jgi:hypothetical protein
MEGQVGRDDPPTRQADESLEAYLARLRGLDPPALTKEQQAMLAALIQPAGRVGSLDQGTESASRQHIADRPSRDENAGGRGRPRPLAVRVLHIEDADSVISQTMGTHEGSRVFRPPSPNGAKGGEMECPWRNF